MKEENNVCLSKLESDSTYLSKPKRVRAGKTQEKFIEEVKKVHPEYDFSNTIYQGSKKKLKVECPKHGEFEILAESLLRGSKCPYCNREETRRRYSKSLDTFLNEVKLIHPEYDFSKVEYVNAKTKVEVICNIHGSFFAQPDALLRGCGCTKCYHKRRVKDIELTYDKFKKKLLEEGKGHLHIKEEDYKDRNSPLVFTCNIHGVQHTNRAYNLIENIYGCPKCGNHIKGSKRVVSLEEIKKRLFNKFRDKISIVDSSYTFSTTEATFICQEHGEYTNIVQYVLENKYPCKKCADKYGESDRAYYDKPTTLYYIKLIKDKVEYFKLGITTKSISERFHRLPQEGLTYEILLTKTFETGISAYHLEQFLLHKYNMNIIDFILLPKSGGNSEIFNQDIYESIKQYFD